MNETSHPRVVAADIVLAAIFIVITSLYALFLFNDRVPLIGFALLGLLWLAYVIISGRLTYSTPMDFPILGLLALLPFSLAISVDHALSLPKITGLFLGISIYFWIVNFLRTYHRLRMAIFFLIFLNLALSLLGLAAMDWTSTKFIVLTPLFELLSTVLPSTSNLTMNWEIHPNAIGGVLAFFIPLLAGLAWDNKAFHVQYHQGQRRLLLSHIFYKLLVIVAFFFATLLLVLTESRGAYLGSAVGLIVLAIWIDRRFLWLTVILVIGFVLFFFFAADGSINQAIVLLDTSNEATIKGRFELWQNTIYMIQDFPLTGAGIGTYSQVFEEFYYASIFPLRTQSYLHAHNTFLAIAIDLGLPALILYVSLLTIFATMIGHIFKHQRSVVHAFLRGLACGMIAHHVFGLTDAFVLGTKLGAVLWIFLGLAAAIFAHQDIFMGRNSVKLEESNQSFQWPQRKDMVLRRIDGLVGFGFLIIISLAAITFINFNPIISLCLAALGGIVLSMVLFNKIPTKG